MGERTEVTQNKNRDWEGKAAVEAIAFPSH